MSKNVALGTQVHKTVLDTVAVTSVLFVLQTLTSYQGII